MLKRLHYSSNSPDFKSFLNKYKDNLKQLLTTGNLISSLEKLTVKLADNKKSTALSEIVTINLIDSQKAEITTFDPQVNSYFTTKNN